MFKTLLVCLIITFTTNTFALDASGVFAKVSASIVVVDILNEQGSAVGIGSGVVIGKLEVITNCHVAQKGQSVQVRHFNKTYKATIHYADSGRDLCQLTVPGLQALPIDLGKAKKLKVGQRVYAVGAPKGFELTLSEGLVSSLRDYEGSQYIQTSAAISPGSSGGGLFNEQGELIGITTFYITEGQNLNFALPVDWISELPKRAQLAPLKLKEHGLDWFNKALSLEQQKDWQSLLRFSQDWLKKEPDNVVAWGFLGGANYNLKQYEQAIYCYRQSLYSQSGSALLWNNLGLTYYSVGRNDDAITAYIRALEINPDYASAWTNLGLANNEKKQYDLALQAQLEAVRIEPQNESILNNLGVTYEALNQTEQAIRTYQEALRIQPKDAVTWRNLGVVYVKNNMHEQANKALREALRIKPDFTDAWMSLGASYSRQKNHDKVLEIYSILKKLDPVKAEIYFKTLILP